MKKALSKLFGFLGKANSENGEPSNMRVIVMYSAFLFSTSLTFVFVYVAINHESLILGMAGIISALLTTIFGWKVYQKGKESQNISSQNSESVQ